jgi:hypothetical protein
MIEGTKKMELDAKEGREYSWRIRLRDVGKNGDSEEKKSNKKVRTGEPNNNQLTQRTAREQCKCDGDNHKQISSSRCPWKGLSKEEVTQNYVNRMSEIVVPKIGMRRRLFLPHNLRLGLQRKRNGNLEIVKNSTVDY